MTLHALIFAVWLFSGAIQDTVPAQNTVILEKLDQQIINNAAIFRRKLQVVSQVLDSLERIETTTRRQRKRIRKIQKEIKHNFPPLETGIPDTIFLADTIFPTDTVIPLDVEKFTQENKKTNIFMKIFKRKNKKR